MTKRLKHLRKIVGSVAMLLLATVAACDDDNGVAVPPENFDPELIDARATWIEAGWLGRDAFGDAAVELRWTLPDEWDGEVFRVYSRAGGSGDYFLVATVTSCASFECVYTDINVEPGRSYDYFVAAVDERTNEEVGESEALQVAVPNEAQPAMPTGVIAVALDNGIFLRWGSTGAEKYRIFLERIGADSVFFEIGATDGVGYLDSRAENGTSYTYRVAGLDQDGYVSRRSDGAEGIPRPDYHAELIYPLTDSALASGFRFAASESENPIVAGAAAEAQWRLEDSGGELLIVPRGQTRVTQGIFTTDLSCGPGSEVDCEHVAEAPASSAFTTAAVPVSAGNTYVFEVSVGGQTHFGKIRVHGSASDGAGGSVVVFDWAYQLVANEPSLNVSPLGR
jgi:hypothetical protein